MSAAIALANRSVIRQHREPSTMILRKRYTIHSSPLFLHAHDTFSFRQKYVPSIQFLQSRNLYQQRRRGDRRMSKRFIPSNLCVIIFFPVEKGKLFINKEGGRVVVNRLKRKNDFGTTITRKGGGGAGRRIFSQISDASILLQRAATAPIYISFRI